MRESIGTVRPSACVCVAVLCLLAGCSRADEGLVLVSNSVVAPALLRSEAEQIAIPVRIDAPLRFENRSAEDKLVSVGRQGCSCYGMATARFVLQAGELVKVPAGGAVELFFAARLLEADGDQSFRVTFLAQDGTGLGGQPRTHELTADGTMKIVPDLVLEPASIVVDLPADGSDGLEQQVAYPLRLTRVTRGRPGAEEPEFLMSPGFLKAERCRANGDAVEIAPGLWRTTWTTSVTVDALPAEVQDNGGRFPFGLQFPDTPDAALVAPERRREQGTMPTALEVERNLPERKVLGTLVLRRSRGVIAPAQIHFGALAAGSGPRERRIVLTSADQQPFVVTVGKSPARFHAVVDSLEPAPQQWVTVTFSPDVPGEVSEELMLKTSHVDQSDVRVTLKGRVQ